MIAITEILTVDRILCQQNINSKKKTLEIMSNLLAQPLEGNMQPVVFKALLDRERLGSTGLGSGTALPHGRIEALHKPVAAIATLSAGIEFDALDTNPVNLVFALAMPENCDNQHLKILAFLAEMFGDASLCTAVCQASTPNILYQHLNRWRKHARSA